MRRPLAGEAVRITAAKERARPPGPSAIGRSKAARVSRLAEAMALRPALIPLAAICRARSTGLAVDLVDRADAQRLVGVERQAREDDFQRLGFAHHAGQPLGAGRAREMPTRSPAGRWLRRPDWPMRMSQARLSSKPPPHAQPVDRRHHRLGRLGKQVDQARSRRRRLPCEGRGGASFAASAGGGKLAHM